jgi:hypothetical protein
LFVATIGGAGLGSLKFPDYIHPGCKERFLNKKRTLRKRFTDAVLPPTDDREQIRRL